MTVSRCTNESGAQLREHAQRELLELGGGEKTRDVTGRNHPGYRTAARGGRPLENRARDFYFGAGISSRSTSPNVPPGLVVMRVKARHRRCERTF